MMRCPLPTECTPPFGLGLGLRQRRSHGLCVLSSPGRLGPGLQLSRPDCWRSPNPNEALVGGRYRRACV